MLLLLSDQNCSNRRDRTDRGSCQFRSSRKVEVATRNTRFSQPFVGAAPFSPVCRPCSEYATSSHQPLLPNREQTEQVPRNFLPTFFSGKTSRKLFCLFCVRKGVRSGNSSDVGRAEDPGNQSDYASRRSPGCPQFEQRLPPVLAT